MKSFFSRFFRGAIFLSLISLSIFFVSCSSGDDDASVYGRWRSDSEYGYEIYVITPFSFSSYWRGTGDETDTLSYAGTIVGSEKLDDSSYYIYIRYTSNSTDPSVEGKYYCISITDLSDTTCRISGAAKGEYPNTIYSADTFSGAKKMTIEDGWFTYYSACVRE